MNIFVQFNQFLIIVEEIKAVILPKEYKLFIKEFGGGYFAFTNIFSVSDSGWNIIQQNNEVNLINSHKFIAISDNELGDFYGFEIENGICNPKVNFYDHQLNNVAETKFEDLCQYLLNVGLKQG